MEKLKKFLIVLCVSIISAYIRKYTIMDNIDIVDTTALFGGLGLLVCVAFED